MADHTDDSCCPHLIEQHVTLTEAREVFQCCHCGDIFEIVGQIKVTFAPDHHHGKYYLGNINDIGDPLMKH